ncbi:MAG: hypothetical protein NVSMB64_28320 [Candidatus Velthaea sp.]
MAETKGRRSTADHTSTLKVGDKAPDFALARHDSPDPWKLSERAGKANVVIAFYPFAFTGT